MSEDSGQSAERVEEEGSACASPTPSLTPSLPASLAAPPTPVIPTAPDTPCSEHSVAPSSASVQSDIGEPPRPRLSPTELESLTLSDLIQHWKELDVYTDWLDNQAASQDVEIANLRAFAERAKQQHLEASAREKAVLRRLATKEQEIQELMAQITDLKSSATPTAGSLRSAFLDPAVNLLLQKLRTELTTAKAQLEETQNELSAWKFTPDSNTGKRLMAKCRQLYHENEDLGKLVASGRVAKLEGELALQKSFSLEVKKSQSELDEFLQELDEDVEGMQSTVYYLQQELRKSRETISSLERKLNKYKKGNVQERLKHINKSEEAENSDGPVRDGGVAESEDNDNNSEEEEGGSWKDEIGCNSGGEEVRKWREDDEGEDEWNQWEGDEVEGETNDFAEDESTSDWLHGRQEKDTKDPTERTPLGDKDNLPKQDSVASKRTKCDEDSGDNFEAPVRKKLRSFLSEVDSNQEVTIVEGLNESNSVKNAEIA